jgi:hypothetical protein
MASMAREKMGPSFQPNLRARTYCVLYLPMVLNTKILSPSVSDIDKPFSRFQDLSSSIHI